ncbi:MAG: cytochrome c [Chthoniobacter sp.]|nr:cytochrome c [Chthoniobacter sp.]
MLRYFFIAFLLAVVAILALAGPRDSKFFSAKSARPPIEIFPDMDHQPKFQPQHPSGFFADGRAGRQPVDGTVPLGYGLHGSFLQAGAKNGAFEPAGFANQPDYFNTGKFGDSYGDGFPLEVSSKFVARGQERFNINCAVCHGKAGLGNGVAGQYGVAAIANLVDDRIRAMPDGQLFSTITNGKNTMGAYGPQIAIEDRWAIVAYLRALQKSQGVKLAELPEAQQKELQSKQ